MESDSLHSSQVIYGHHFTPNASAPNIELSVGSETPATKDVSREDFEISNGSKGMSTQIELENAVFCTLHFPNGHFCILL